MSRFIALRLRKLPVIHWCLTPEPEVEQYQEFLVQTQHGCEVARVLRVLPEGKTRDLADDNFIKSLKRSLNESDRETLHSNAEKEAEAFRRGRQMIKDHKLEMRLLKTEYLFDCSRLIFYFKADNKVDFRELLKSLASTFKTRIELRQIGVRDEAKLLGGLGCCGKEVCCAQFMSCFYPVSTKMAKDQNLSLNPAKLSGLCGRLLCCLGHEYNYYASFHGKFPKLGAEIVIGSDKAKVMDLNYITQRMLVGYFDRRKESFDLDMVHGRKDPDTGRNMWWIQHEGEEEPDLAILFQQNKPRRPTRNDDRKTSRKDGRRSGDDTKDKDPKGTSDKGNRSRKRFPAKRKGKGEAPSGAASRTEEKSLKTPEPTGKDKPSDASGNTKNEAKLTPKDSS